MNEATKKLFCANCGSSIVTESTKFPGIVILKAGIMNGSLDKFKPASESFTNRKPQWLPCVDGVPQFPEQFEGQITLPS